MIPSMTERHYSNQELASIFQKIGSLLEIKGELIYKILAYRKAADSLENLGMDASALRQQGKLTEIPGVGKAIAEKIDELFRTGSLEFLVKLEAEVPPTLVDLLQVPDLGPKKIALFWKQLGVTDLAGLEAAARAGKLQSLPGMGDKSEAAHHRRDRGALAPHRPHAARQSLAFRPADPGGAAGRAGRPGGGSGRQPAAHALDGRRHRLPGLRRRARPPVMQAFTGLPDVARVVGQGEVKASVEFSHNLRAQLWVHPPERFGTALQYATGSKDHNVRLRELALKTQAVALRPGLLASGRQRDAVRHRRRSLRHAGPALDPARAARRPRRGRSGAGRQAARAGRS